MRMLLIYPPQWNPTSPYLSVPLLAGQLKAAGYETDIIDLNVQFFNRILTSSHLHGCIEEAERIYDGLKVKISASYPDAESNYMNYPPEVQTELMKLQKLHSFFAHGNERSSAVIGAIDKSVAVLRDNTDFYDPEKLFDAKSNIQEALKIASLPYAPNELIWDNYFNNPVYKLDWENIDSQCRDESLNMFLKWFEEKADEIAAHNYDYIGISVPDLSQLTAAFTLSLILKKKTGAHINIAGNYITQNKNDFLNHPEIFGEYVDSLSVGDGETAIITMARYINGEIPREEVRGIIYKAADGTLLCGKDAEKFRMSEVKRPCFDGIDFSLYFSPETVLPMQLGKGCYWGKCAFCDYYYGQQCFDIKSAADAVSEMKFYKEKYGITHFMFIDEAVPPQYYSELSDRLLEDDTGIYYYSFARLERQFTPELLEKMYKSGCRILLWGYECHSLRLMKMMNKGIDSEHRMDILRASHNAGIWNNALFIIGYPTETIAEINDTLDVIMNNRDIINSCTPSNFSLKKNALIMKTVGKNGVISYKTNGEFYTVYKDEIEGTSQNERREIRRQFHLDMIKKHSHCLWPVVYSDFDCTLLYLAKYGLDYTASYRSPRNICLMFR